MRTKFIVLLACAPILTQAARPERNSYLDVAATSVSALVSQVEHHPQVADRYMRHFGMTRNEVIAKFSKLHVERLRQDITVTMYSVPGSGAIRQHTAKLHKGELMFDDSHGVAILRVKCGNPVTAGKVAAVFPTPPGITINPPSLASLVEYSAPPDQAPTNTLALVPETPADEFAEAVPTTIHSDVVDKVPSTTVQTTITPNPVTEVGPTATGNHLNLLPLLPLLGIPPLLLHHPSGGGNPSNPLTTPEPLSAVALGVGVLGLAARRRRSRG